MRSLILLCALGLALAVAAASDPQPTGESASAIPRSPEGAGTGEPASAAGDGAASPSPAAEELPAPTVAMAALDAPSEDQLLEARESGYRWIAVRGVRPEVREGVDEFAAANPGTRVLLYVDAGFMGHDPDDPAACEYWPHTGDGVDYCAADRRHEGWFLHRAGAAPGPETRLESDGYPGMWAADVADPGYQRRWIENVRRRLAAAEASGAPFDGVLVDDINLLPGHGLDGRIAELGDAEYGRAAAAFGARIGSELRGDGYDVIANVAIDVHDPRQRELARELAGELTAFHREQFVRYGDSGPLFTSPETAANDWLSELAVMRSVQRSGAGYAATLYSSDPEADAPVAQYALATLLTGWDGESQVALIFRTLDGSEPLSHPAWQTRVGAPLGPARVVGDGEARLRPFSLGVVAVNPDAGREQKFDLGGPHRDPLTGECVESLTLPPAAGRVLPRC